MTLARVKLPTLHRDQVNIFRLREDARATDPTCPEREAWAKNAGGRFRAVRCGRRYGKTTFGETWVADGALKGEPVGWFAPGYKYVAEVYQELATMLEPVITHASKQDGVIRLSTGGRIDFWSLENENAGRSRKYKRTFIDEAAYTKNSTMMGIWEKSIKPTLLDLGGACIAASNTNGVDPDNFLYALCNDPKYGFVEYHAPSWSNPTIPERMRAPGMGHNGGPALYSESVAEWRLRQGEVYAGLRATNDPLVFSQEYAAEFVDWSGAAFFNRDKLLVDGAPVALPPHCDAVFAVVDSATKTGSGNDGTAVIYVAVSRHGAYPLIVLDWDVVQIEGAVLEAWLPSVFNNLEHYARQCGARSGSLGAFIEDKDSGQILIQQAANRGWPAHAIESPLTALGKDGRALSVSGYVYQGKVKFSAPAYDKTVLFKGSTRNHLWAQVVGFKIGDKEAARRADDCLDTFTYAVALALGNSEGF